MANAEPAWEWGVRAIRPLPDTRTQPAMLQGRSVAAAIVVEL